MTRLDGVRAETELVRPLGWAIALATGSFVLPVVVLVTVTLSGNHRIWWGMFLASLLPVASAQVASRWVVRRWRSNLSVRAGVAVTAIACVAILGHAMFWTIVAVERGDLFKPEVDYCATSHSSLRERLECRWSYM